MPRLNIPPRRLVFLFRPGAKDGVYSASWHAAWLVLFAGLFVVLAAGAIITVLTYQKARRQIHAHSGLVLEVESLRVQNARLRDLSAELTELRELQQQMLRLAGIETALGVDLQLLQDIRAAQHADTLATDPNLLLWPLTGPVTSGFTVRHPGIDIEAPLGHTIVAAGMGVVEQVGVHPRFGHHLVLKHFNDLRTVYGNIALNLVEAGDTVRVGQVIALVGNEGETDVPHLHLEVLREGEPVEPASVIRQAGP